MSNNVKVIGNGILTYDLTEGYHVVQSHGEYPQVSADVRIKDIEIEYLAHQYYYEELCYQILFRFYDQIYRQQQNIRQKPCKNMKYKDSSELTENVY